MIIASEEAIATVSAPDPVDSVGPVILVRDRERDFERCNLATLTEGCHGRIRGEADPAGTTGHGHGSGTVAPAEDHPFVADIWVASRQGKFVYLTSVPRTSTVAPSSLNLCWLDGEEGAAPVRSAQPRNRRANQISAPNVRFVTTLRHTCRRRIEVATGALSRFPPRDLRRA